MTKFKSLQFYSGSTGSYELLPFRFTQLRGNDYVVTNLVGEFVVLDRDDLEAFAKGKMANSHPAYRSLKVKHFLSDADSGVSTDLLALKARTKFGPLANFTGLHLFVTTLRCDHSCPYCQVSRVNDRRREFDMSEETALKSLDLTFR